MKEINDKSFHERYTITNYFAITFFITIILGMLYQFIGNVFISPQYAPTLGLVIISVLSKNWSIWEKMNWNPFKISKGLMWMLISLLLPVIIINGKTICILERYDVRICDHNHCSNTWVYF